MSVHSDNSFRFESTFLCQRTNKLKKKNKYVCMCMYVCVSFYRSIKMKSQICLSPESGRSSKLTHVGVEINACTFQMGCQLSSAVSTISLGMCFTQFLWRETNVLNNWKLAVLRQSGGTEFELCSIRDNLSIPLWVICVSLCHRIKIKPQVHVCVL